jgi:2-desacetyl-2-hydroxyethyl bacteriochlorophyllide A dehydrogenase
VLARQLWVTGPYEVGVREFELADEPPDDKVLIVTERSLMSAGTELAIVMGTHIGFTTGAAWPRYPMALGYTALGRVAAIGRGVSDVAVGDRILAQTPHASHAFAEPGQRQRVPDGCDPDGALLAQLANIPLCGVRMAEPRLGEGMVVMGQGLIGGLAARFGRAAGCRPVLGVDPIAERRRVAEGAGIVAVDPTSSAARDVHRRLAEGRDPEIVVEATGVPSVIADALELAADAGRVVLLGSPRGRVEIDPYTHIHRKGIHVIGAHARMTPNVATPANPFTSDRNRALALTLLADGSLDTRGLISHHIRPEQARQTYQELAERAPGYMGVVVDWTA